MDLRYFHYLSKCHTQIINNEQPTRKAIHISHTENILTLSLFKMTPHQSSPLAPEQQQQRFTELLADVFDGYYFVILVHL